MGLGKTCLQRMYVASIWTQTFELFAFKDDDSETSFTRLNSVNIYHLVSMIVIDIFSMAILADVSLIKLFRLLKKNESYSTEEFMEKVRKLLRSVSSLTIQRIYKKILKKYGGYLQLVQYNFI